MGKLLKRKIKKLITVIFITVVFVILLTPVTTAVSPTYTAPVRTTVDAEGHAQFEIKVTPAGSYAGIQFEIILDNGISIESISFNKGDNSGILPPTLARGSYFFSIFSKINEFEGEMICTVKISYTGRETPAVTIAGIQSYYVENRGNVSTETSSISRTVTIDPYEPPPIPSPIPTPSPTPTPTPDPPPSPPPTPTPPPPPGGGGSGGNNIGQDISGGQSSNDTEQERIALPESDIGLFISQNNFGDEDYSSDNIDDEQIDIYDEEVPLVSFINERDLPWILIVIITVISAAAASFFTEIKRRRKLALKIAAEGITKDNAKSAQEDTK